MNGLQIKYFVLKPHGDDAYAKASRAAMRAYANHIMEENQLLCNDLREWADHETPEFINAIDAGHTYDAGFQAAKESSRKELDMHINNEVKLTAEIEALEKKLAEEKTGWTCYHCGEHFITHTHAKLHFGIPHSGAQPACLIKQEQGLVKYIRELEVRLGKAMEEDSDTLRDMANQRVEKANAVSDAEELGYSRGLQAYTKIESELSATQAREVMLVEALKEVDTMVNNQGLSHQLIQKALSNSTEHTEKWLAEHDANVLEDAANRFRNENCTLLPSTIECAETLETLANELRSGK